MRGFEQGVDDYVTKPFSFAEIIARVSAVLGRARQTPTDHKPKRYVSGNLVIDTDARRVTKSGKIMSLPRQSTVCLQLSPKTGSRSFP